MQPMRDESGGIEGMPLQLMILVIVAGLTLAVVLGWTLSIQGPSVISSVSTTPATVELGATPEDQVASRTVTIQVSAFDGKAQPVRGIVVTIRGAVDKAYVAQDGDDGAVDGTAAFSGVRVSLPPGVATGDLALTIQKSGYPARTWSIPVVRA